MFGKGHSMYRRVITFCALAVLLALPAAPPTQAQPASRYFPETDLTISGRFLQFWEGNGGLPVFGLPLSNERFEAGSEGRFTTQWFERERFEYHPENAPPYDVLLGRLGDEALRRQGRAWQAFPKGTPQAGCLFFAETQHSLCEPFLSYWRSNGLEFDGQGGTSYNESLALFGLPLSEPQTETNSSGLTVLTQWFERARFEHLPDNPDPYKVLLGRLGAEAFDPTAGNGPTQYVAVQRPGWDAPLEVPQGFTIEEVARGLERPRFMALDGDGSLLYGSDSASEVVRLRDFDGDGFYETRQTVAGGLPYVHSVAVIDGQLYAASETKIVRLSEFSPEGPARRVETVIDNLPGGSRDLYGHRTRTIERGPDGKLYISVGSSCDVCSEDTPLRAALLRANLDGSGLELFASGLRNTVGFDFQPGTGAIWGVDMGRNNVGDAQPPEELNRIEQGRSYGWPRCTGSDVVSPEFNDPGACQAQTPPVLTFPAHWAPLGLRFYDAYGFPPSYIGDAFVAFHGSAADQTKQRVGYRVVRVRFRNGQPVGYEDLVRGWAVGDTVWGRPAGLLVAPDGSVLISDDGGGRIYRLRYSGS
jgi:glucose/arabinose dehydrogenase